jgi:hypothetical protein
MARLPSRQAVAEAAEALRRVLAVIDAGELDVTNPRDVALVRRLQGALMALKAVSGYPPGPAEPKS